MNQPSADEPRPASQDPFGDEGPSGIYGPTARPEPDAPVFSTPVADSFSGYRLTREVRKGGQGMVFQAIQKTTRRKVAIKVMREGHFGDLREKARFEREVQILGQLNHPGVVAIHDSGTTPSGQFFYVMDYISGQPLDTYIESGPHKVDETLPLFLKICDAVNAAHLKGVIHRDIKPSNILIDADGEPHILDFGLAKVATSEVTAHSVPQVMTVTGQFMGSIPWASPEQAEGIPAKIDLRTDVYSLGVVLYQMLTGQFPYQVTGTMNEVLNRILTVDPVRPSTISRQINNEVETIVLKCLAKQRERRYQSAGELGRDIRHYLAGEAIEAKRDSIGYVLTKQLKRYKFAVAVAVGFVVLVTAGFVISTGLWRAAAQARSRAQMEAEKADAVSKFLTGMLTAADPGSDAASGNREITVREILDKAGEKVEKELGQQPVLEAQVRQTIASTYQALGYLSRAEPHIRAAIRLRKQTDGESMALADTISWLVLVLLDQQKFVEAEPLAADAVEMYRKVLPPGHPDLPESLNNLARSLLGQEGKLDEAELVCREGLAGKVAIEKQRPDYPAEKIAYSRSTLARILKGQRRFDESEIEYREALRLFRQAHPREHRDVARCLWLLASLLEEVGRFAEAERLYGDSLDMYRKIRDPEHPDVAAGLECLGHVLLAERQFPEAERRYREALDMRLKALPAGDWQVASARSGLGAAIVGQGVANPARLAEAEPILLESDAVLAGHPPVADRQQDLDHARRESLDRIASLYKAWGKPEEAAKWAAKRAVP